MIRSLRDTAIVSYITKKSKIIYELLSEHIDWFVKINIKILINPKKIANKSKNILFFLPACHIIMNLVNETERKINKMYKQEE